MKRNIIHTLWTVALPLLLASCQREELPDMNGTSDLAPLSITVTDGGYSSDGQQTKAAENGYRTEFTAGDECGLYIVRGGTSVYDNVKLTATAGTDGSLTWQSEADVTLAGGFPGESWFLYYPYQTDMTGKVDVTANDAEGFFAPLVSGWQPESDQSTYANYTASDLMTAKGTATKDGGSLKLTFSMTHRMALAVIEMPKTVYKFTNTAPIPDYTVALSADFTVSSVKPYGISPGTYRCIVNPTSGTATSITGSYDGGKKEFTVTPNIAAGSCKTYKIDGLQTVQKIHNLQVGDFLLADGSLVGKDKTLTAGQQAACAGIVFWTPAETDPAGRQTPASLADDKIMAVDYPACTHGLAVAVKQVTYEGYELMPWQSSGRHEQVGDWQAGDGFTHANKDKFVSVASGTGVTDNINRIYGYQNTVVLRAYNAYCTGNGKPDFIVRPVAALDAFKDVNSAPSNSTGWFLPSAKELSVLVYKDVDDVYDVYSTSNDTRDMVNTSLSAAGGDVLKSMGSYWSSSEKDGSYYNAFSVHFSNANVEFWAKDSEIMARVVCAF